jgi:hypothetical protein
LKYIRYRWQFDKINLYPLVCWHIGAKQSRQDFIDKVIKTIANDPYARWIYMGDAGECVTKTSKGNIYEQLLNPGDQFRTAVNLMEPIMEKGLFGIRGNHGNRIDKDSGVGWDEILCERIGIPYAGVSAMLDLGVGKTNLSVYVHHGTSGAITAGGKMAGAHRAEQFIASDVILTAHTHACGEAWPTRYMAVVDRRNKCVEWKKTHSFVCGSAYDSRSGYAEEKMYPPLVPEHLVISIEEKGDGDFELTHSKILL